MNTLIFLLVFVLVMVIIFWLLNYIPVAQPAKNIIFAIVALIGIIYLLSHLGVLSGIR